MTCFFALIISAFVDLNTCPQVWIQIVYGTYTNWTWIFSYPAGLWKVVVRVPVGCDCLLMPICCFDWYKISFKLFTQCFLCWFLTCVFCIYRISIHWSEHFSLSMISNFLWAIYKPDIRIWLPCRFVEGCGKGGGCVDSLVIINLFTVFKSTTPSYSC